MWGASKAELSITAGVTVHGAGLDDPFSNPGLPSNCCVVPPPLVTVRLIVAECVCPPPEPVTETLYVPTGVEEPAVIVKDEKPAPGAAIDVGLKPAVAPDGRPDVESETVALNPAETLVVIVEIPELP